MKPMKLILIIVVTSVLTMMGTWQFWHYHSSVPPRTSHEVKAAPTAPKILYWYDPMVPEQKFDKAGKSPFMDMELVPKYADNVADHAANTGVTINADVVQNLGIRVVSVQKSQFSQDISAVGRLEVDEHRLYAIQTRSAGFVEHLWVRAVGDTVRAGQKVADVYAPELLAAQQEYLALLTLSDINDIDTLRQAARQRLRLLGMNEGEINTISQTGRANPRIGIYASASGVVTELLVREGGQLLPATNLMQIADLSSLWLLLELPERDAARLKIGDAVEAWLESLPLQRIKGHLDYLYPSLDNTTRSVRVRVVLANPSGQLKTGMFATASLAGQRREVMTVPSEAVISTGTRTVVIIKDGQHFRPVAIQLGTEQNGLSEVTQGLNVGEKVVSSGQFLIDSEASLNGVLARLSSHTELNHD